MARTTVEIQSDIQAERKAAAERFRLENEQRGTLVVRLVSSPGAGKTTLLQATARAWAGRLKMGVLVGDIATDRDARRLDGLAPAVQITTGGACHLELPLVEQALPSLTGGPFDVLFIEDVGNLVCPASHDLGEHVRVTLLSVTEGDDKPGKYPKMFRTSQMLLITKSDLLPYVPFSIDAAVADARAIQPELTVHVINALGTEGIEGWCAELERRRAALL